jgi:hypothetical protein
MEIMSLGSGATSRELVFGCARPFQLRPVPMRHPGCCQPPAPFGWDRTIEELTHVIADAGQFSRACAFSLLDCANTSIC